MTIYVRLFCIVTITITAACGSREFREERTYEGVFDGLNLSTDNIQKVKQLDVWLFREGQEIFEGPKERVLNESWVGPLDEKQRNFHIYNRNFMRQMVFRGRYSTVIPMTDFASVRISTKEVVTKNSNIAEPYYPTAMEEIELKTVELIPGSCVLKRLQKEHEVLKTFALIHYDEQTFSESSQKASSVRESSSNSKSDTVYCIIAGHLFHLGASGIERLDKSRLVYARKNKEISFDLRMLWLTNFLIYRHEHLGENRLVLLREMAEELSKSALKVE